MIRPFPFRDASQETTMAKGAKPKTIAKPHPKPSAKAKGKKGC